MEFASFHPRGQIVFATAVHNGHELRPDLDSKAAVDEATRLREEDPYTDALAQRIGSYVVVNRSRFEVDLNRERTTAVYASSDDAWGIQLWEEPLTGDEIEVSLRSYDDFYARLSATLDDLVAAQGGFVLYDLHSYNHRRRGPDDEPEPLSENPAVNLGTGSLPQKWAPVADAFLSSMREARVGGGALDVRQNVRFQGRQVAKWVHDRYGESSCALAIEFKKTFMDEWSGELDRMRLEELGDGIAASVDAVSAAWEAV
jgi:N-formylglutamate deformylase